MEAVRQLSPERRGADVVIEAVGRPEAWEWAVQMVRKGGTVNFFGGCAAGTKVQLDTNRLALFRNYVESDLPPHTGDGASGVRPDRGKEGSRQPITSLAKRRSRACRMCCGTC